MINLPDNPIADKIPLIYPIKRINISTPCNPHSGLMLQIVYDAGMDMRLPELDIPDNSSPNAIIEQRKAVTVSGWSRMSDTYILLPSVFWTSPADIEAYISEIGWQLGAGYMYRWHHSPGDPHKHLWGLIRYSCAAGDMSSGDDSEELAELAEEHGCWSWEINASYRKADGCSALHWPEWYRCDPSLSEDGSRTAPFPGWDGHHPFLQATEPHTGYESHYFFCPTYRGKGKNKHMHKERGACYVENLKWETREEKSESKMGIKRSV